MLTLPSETESDGATHHKYIPRVSTCEEARKSPVGDMVTLTTAASTRKQSTRLKQDGGQIEGKVKAVTRGDSVEEPASFSKLKNDKFNKSNYAWPSTEVQNYVLISSQTSSQKIYTDGKSQNALDVGIVAAFLSG